MELVTDNLGSYRTPTTDLAPTANLLRAWASERSSGHGPSVHDELFSIYCYRYDYQSSYVLRWLSNLGSLFTLQFLGFTSNLKTPMCFNLPVMALKAIAT